VEYAEESRAGGAEQMRENGPAGLTVRSLLRDGAPDVRAALAERRLVRTIAEWAPGAGIDILVGSAPRGTRVRIDVRPIGDVPAGWRADIQAALEHVGALGALGSRASRVTPPPPILAELVRDPARSQHPIEPDTCRPSDALALGAPAVSWPVSVREAGSDLMAVLSCNPGAFVRMLIAAPTDLERSMLDDQLRQGWDRLANPSFDAYLGVPVRMRTFVGATGRGAGVASLRATVRGWGTAMVIRETDAATQRLFWAMGEADLVGHVRPEGWALAGVRLPVAGERSPVGIATHPRPIPDRPIDLAAHRHGDGIVIGHARTSSGRLRPVTLSHEDLGRHVFVEGRSGTGKTTFAVALAHELSCQGIGFSLLEHHGSGVDQALRALTPATASRAHVVRHGDLAAPGSVSLFGDSDDLVREQTISEFIDLIQRIFDPRAEGIVGPRWRRWFSLLCDAVGAFWGDQATLLHLLAVASDPDLAKKLAVALTATHRDLAHRVHREIGALRGDEASNLPAWAISKFQPLVGSRIMREIVGRAHDSVDVQAVMDEGRALLVDLGGPVVGTPSARMLGALWLLKHWVAMGRRADRTRPHVIIVDEAHLMTVGALPAMLAEARKFGVGVVILSQSIDALAPDLQAAIEANVGTHVSFRLGLGTASRASLRLDGWDPRELVRLPDLTAASTVTRGGVQSEPFLLRVRRPAIDTAQARAQSAALDARRVDRMRPTSPVATDRDVEAALEMRLAMPRTAAMGAESSDTAPVPIAVAADPAPSARAPALDEWLARRRAAAAAGVAEVDEVGGTTC